jgi:hypothetical protein
LVGFSRVALGQPGPDDILGRVNIRVRDMAAAATAERGGVAVPRVDVAACGAGL